MADTQRGMPRPRLACGDCAVDVEKLVRDAEGAADREVDPAPGRMSVTFDLSQLGGGGPMSGPKEPNGGSAEDES